MNINSAKNILIIRLSSLGDVLLTTPIVRSIKNSNHSANIDFIVQNEFSDVYKNNSNLRKCFVYDKEKRSIINSDFFSINNYDLIIDLQNSRRSKEIIRGFSGTINRFKKNSFGKFLLVNTKINLLKNSKQIPERYASYINGLVLDDNGLEIFDETNTEIVNNFEENLIGICPGSKHYTKMWLLEYFIELSNLLISKGFKVAVIGGIFDKQIADKILLSNKNILDLTTENNLQKTAANLAKCRLVICNDSGLMHLASAVKTPLIAIFGSTVKEFGFTPYKCKNLVLENNSLSCRPCSHIGKSACPKKHFKCMKEIKPKFVMNKIEEMLRD